MRIVETGGQRVAVVLPFERRVVDLGGDLLADGPDPGFADRQRRDSGGRTAVDVGQAADGAVEAGSDRARGGRHARRTQPGGVGRTAQPAEAVAQMDLGAEIEVAGEADIADFRAAAVGEIDPAAVVARGDPAVRADQRTRAEVETRIAGQRAAVVRRHDRDRQQPLALVVEIAAVNEDFAPIELVVDVGVDLPTLFGDEARVADAVAARIIAADQRRRAVGERTRHIGVAAESAEIRPRNLGERMDRVAAALRDLVDGQPRLAGTEQDAGAATDRLDAVGGLVEADELAVLEERQRRRREDRDSFALEGDELGVAARRIAADEDVGAVLAARAFDGHAGYHAEEVGGALRREPLDRGGVERRYCERGFLATDARARGADHDDLVVVPPGRPPTPFGGPAAAAPAWGAAADAGGTDCAATMTGTISASSAAPRRSELPSELHDPWVRRVIVHLPQARGLARPLITDG